MILARAKLIAAATAVAGSFWAGWEWRDRAADAELLRKDNAFAAYRLEAEEGARNALQDAINLRETKAQLAATAAEIAALRNQEREVVERVITQEVIRYVSSPVSERVFLPSDWVRIHNAAAGGAAYSMSGPLRTDAASWPNAAPSAASDADALAVVTSNYATCHAVTGQLAALQDWVRATF